MTDTAVATLNAMKAEGMNVAFAEGALAAGYDPKAVMFSDEYVTTKAASLGCEVMESDDLTLLLDLDTAQAVEDFTNRVPFAKALGFLGEDSYQLLKSRSGNTHAVVKLVKPLDVARRIALQAILGSDWRRDALSLASLDSAKKYAVVLFRPKQKRTPDGTT